MAVKAVDSKAADARKGRVAMARMERGRMAVGLMRQEVPGRKGKAALVPRVRAAMGTLVRKARVKTAKTFSYKKQGLTLVTAPGLFI